MLAKIGYEVGDYDRALTEFDRAREAWEAVLADDPNSPGACISNCPH